MNETRKPGQASIRYATCPHHIKGAGAPTGVITRNNGDQVFRTHTKKVGKQTVVCPGSGQIAPPAEETRP